MGVVVVDCAVLVMTPFFFLVVVLSSLFLFVSLFVCCLSDFERARALDPNNPNLAINYRNIGDVECIVLVDSGREPVY